jgi:hypothetical protein
MISRFRPTSSQRFSRPWWTEQVRNFSWVAVVTVLIWIYADMEFTENKDFTMALHFKTTPGSKLALLSDNDVELTFRARGNHGSLEKFEDLKKHNGNRMEIDVSDFPPGNSSVSVEDLLSRDGDLAKSGLTVTSASQKQVQFRLDRLISQEVPVKLDYTGATLSPEPALTPKTMRIEVAQSRWEQIRQEHPDPTLLTEPVNLQKVDTSKPLKLMVLPAIGSVGVQLPEKHEVEVRVQIKTLTEQIALTINVRVVEPVSWLSPTDNTWKEFEFVRKDPLEWRKQVMVTGPRQDLEMLKAREQEVTAFVTLTDEDKKPVSWNMRTVKVSFPPDLQVKLAPSESPTVQFKMVPIH